MRSRRLYFSFLFFFELAWNFLLRRWRRLDVHGTSNERGVTRLLQAPTNCIPNLAKGATVREVKSKAKALTLTVAHPARSMSFT